MSPLRNTLAMLALAAALVAAVAGCSKKQGGAVFDPETGHPADWVAAHGAQALAADADCVDCHGADLGGGISGVSCSSASFNGVGCHASGPGTGHPAGWAAPSAHGRAAKTDLGGCRACHGEDFAGGIARVSCFTCHAGAPHASGWRNGHSGASRENAPVCAICHQENPGSPDCFNNTLCHGQKGSHPSGWAQPSQHGAAAKRSPGSMRGFESCQVCHGGDFGGGSVNVSCFTCHSRAPHPNSWRGAHDTTDQANAGVCADCHRSSPGTAGCFNNTLCHGQKGSHPSNWAQASQHGAAAKKAPGNMKGFETCQSCHGNGFNGGSSGQSCFTCHTTAPHPGNWEGRHDGTNKANAPVCADCHRSKSGPAGCFNNTLCHGNKD